MLVTPSQKDLGELVEGFFFSSNINVFVQEQNWNILQFCMYTNKLPYM